MCIRTDVQCTLHTRVYLRYGIGDWAERDVFKNVKENVEVLLTFILFSLLSEYYQIGAVRSLPSFCLALLFCRIRSSHFPSNEIFATTFLTQITWFYNNIFSGLFVDDFHVLWRINR